MVDVGVPLATSVYADNTDCSSYELYSEFLKGIYRGFYRGVLQGLVRGILGV